jgi:hypothetical protein
MDTALPFACEERKERKIDTYDLLINSSGDTESDAAYQFGMIDGEGRQCRFTFVPGRLPKGKAKRYAAK